MFWGKRCDDLKVLRLGEERRGRSASKASQSVQGREGGWSKTD